MGSPCSSRRPPSKRRDFRCGYRCRIASTCQHLPCEDEFRIEILLLRLVIDNGDPPQRAIFSMETPLSLEHFADIVAKAPAGGKAERLFHFPAAGELGLCQEFVQERATGIGVDLDELWPALGEVEVETHEHARRDRDRPGQFPAPRTAPVPDSQPGG